MDRTEKQVGVDLPPHADNNLPQLEKGLSHNNDRPPPDNGDGSESDSGGARTLLGDETYPEGGRVAWLVVFGCWCGLFAGSGIMNTIATLQAYAATHQLSDYSEGTVSWIFSLYNFLVFFCGVYVGPLFDKYGPKWLILVGGIGHVVALMLTSICTRYWHFILAFGILNGVSTSLLFTPCYTAVGHFFRARRGTATGIASTGGGVGGIAFSQLLGHLLPRVGWGWSIRVVGFISLLMVVLCNISIRRRLPAATNASIHPDFRIFRERAFLLTTIGVFLLEFGLFIPLAYTSSYALAQGFGETFAFGTIMSLLNAASVLGRLLPCIWADSIGAFNINMMCVALTVVGTLAVWLPAGHTVAGIVVFVVFFGFGTGTNISVTPVCVGKLCHTQHYGRYYAACYTTVSFATLVGLPVAGAIVSAAGGRYWGLIVVTGLTEVLSLLALMAAKVVSVGWKPLANF